MSAASQPLHAPPVDVTSSSGRIELLREARLREASRLFRSPKNLVELPLAAALLLVFWDAGYPRERVAGLLALFVVLFAFQALELIFSRGREEPSHEAVVALTGALVLLVEGVMLALTGGLASPLLISFTGFPVTAFATYGRGRESQRTLAASAALVALLFLAPPALVGPRLPLGHYAAAALLALGGTVLRLRALLFRIADGNLRAVEELDRLRAENLRLAEERERTLRQVGAKVAHELKNPLAAIQGLVQLLQRNTEDDRSRERLEVVASEAARMAVLVRDYLSLNRPLEDLQPRTVALGALSREVVAVLSARAEQAGVRLACEGDLSVEADPRRLKEALLNLVANAVEATPAGGEVTVGLHRGDGQVEVRVTDSGRGMTQEQLARLGTPFFTTREEGTGLGVLLARAVAEQHGGSLRYESEPGRGTRAVLALRHPSTPA